MEDTSSSSASSLFPSQKTDIAAGKNNQSSEVVAQRSTTKTCSATEILHRASADDCSSLQTYSSTSSGSSADTTITMSADYGEPRSSLWGGKEMSSASFSSFGSSASLSSADMRSIARADKDLLRSLQSSARVAAGASAGIDSIEKVDYLLASNGSGDTRMMVTPSPVEKQQHLQEKQEQQLQFTTVDKEAAGGEFGETKCVSGGSVPPRDFPCGKLESQKPRRDSNDSNWRAGRPNLGKVETTGGRIDTSWRSPAKMGNWRTSRQESNDKKKLSEKIDSSSLFSAQLEKAIINLANIDVGRAGAEERGLKHFATELQRMPVKSALTGAGAAGSPDRGVQKHASRSNGWRTEPPTTVAGRHPTVLGTTQNVCGQSFLLPPEIVTEEYIKRPTSAPPTLSKFSASTLFAFPPYESADNGFAERSRNKLYYQILQELCQTLRGQSRPRESTYTTQRLTNAAEGDGDLPPAAAAAPLLQEQQRSGTDLNHEHEWLQQRGQNVTPASEQHRTAEQRHSAVAALKFPETKQVQGATSGLDKVNNDRVSFAVAAVAAALLRESQPSWRDDKHGNLQTLTAGANLVNRVGLQALSTSTSGEGSLSSASISSTLGTETPREAEQRRFASDCARGNRSQQPTTLAATAAVALKGGKQDLAVSLSVPHSPVGLSSVLSSPCSSKPPTRLPHPSTDHRSHSNGTALLDTTVAEPPGCFARSPRELSGEPRILHEHHRLLLSLPQDCDDDLNGCQAFGTTPHITVVKIDDDKQSNNNSKAREEGLFALDAATRALVSAAAGSKAEMLLQQLESEEREVFRCASAPPGETAASLLCTADFKPLSPAAQADAVRKDAANKENLFLRDVRTAESASESNSSLACRESICHSQVSQNAPGATPAGTGKGNTVCDLEEQDLAATSTGDLFNKRTYASSAGSALSSSTTQQAGFTPTGSHGPSGTHIQQQQLQGVPQADTDDSEQTREAHSGGRVPLNFKLDASVPAGGGSVGYPPLYNPQTVLPGHQFCVPPTSVPGCWEEDHAAFFVPRRAADVAGAMAAAYGPSSPHSNVFLGHPPVMLPLGTSTAAEIQQQAMRAAAGAFFLQHQSAAVAAAAAAHRGNSHEWTQSAMMQPLGAAAGERTAAPVTAQPAAPLQLDFLRGGMYYGGAGTCCGVSGVGLASGYPGGERYFPDPLAAAAAATFATMDSYNWARLSSFPGGPVGYHDGHSFGGGCAELGTANAGDRLGELPKFQQLQQPLPTWPVDGSDITENVSGSGDHTGPASSRTTRSPRLTSANCTKSHAREPSTKVDMGAEEFFSKAPSSIEDRVSRGEGAAPPCDWLGDRPFSDGTGTAGSTCPCGKIARSGHLEKLEEETLRSQVQTDAEPTLTRERFKGHVAALARDQLGCRLLQRVIGEGEDPADVQIIYEELLEDAADLMLDPFGNYLVQKVFEALSDDQFRVYLTRASAKLVKACLSTHGTRAVQKVVEVIAKQADPRISLKIFVDAVEPALPTLIRDTNANHVIQKVVTTLPPSYCDFVFTHVEAHCVAICKERHGCCVVQRCIDAAGRETKMATDAIIGNLKGKICVLSKQKCSSNVIEKCLVHGTAGHVRAIVGELLEGGEDKFRDVLLDQYGNYASTPVQCVCTVPGRPAASPALVEAVKAKEATQAKAHHPKAGEWDKMTDKTVPPIPASKKMDCHNSSSNVRGMREMRNGAQNRFTRETERKSSLSGQAFPKVLKKKKQRRDAVGHVGVTQRQPESSPTTWTPISQTVGVSAGGKNNEEKRTTDLVVGNDGDTDGRRCSSIWVTARTLNIQSARSSRSRERSSVVEINRDRPRDSRVCNTSQANRSPKYRNRKSIKGISGTVQQLGIRRSYNRSASPRMQM